MNELQGNDDMEIVMEDENRDELLEALQSEDEGFDSDNYGSESWNQNQGDRDNGEYDYDDEDDYDEEDD